MTSIVIPMILVLLIALGVVGVVIVGMLGRGSGRAPRVANQFHRAAQHLNGEGQPPRVPRLLTRTR